MLRKKTQGFTLIELMVVIVIIGVLASLAIPRFTEASDRAKVAEAPRILASYESAFLAAVAEKGDPGDITEEILIFDVGPVNTASKWFTYTVRASDTDGGPAGACMATPSGTKGIGRLPADTEILTDYDATDTDASKHAFVHTADKDNGQAARYLPNFF